MMNTSSGLQPYSGTKKFIIEPFSTETIPWECGMLTMQASCHSFTNSCSQYYSYDLVITKKVDYFHVPKDQDIAAFYVSA